MLLVCLLLTSFSCSRRSRRVAAPRTLLLDWAGLTRYGSENAEIRAPKPAENRVVFLGDQITEWLGLASSPASHT